VDDSHIEELLDETQNLFQKPESKVEEGLDVDDPSLLQLRKACRLLDAAQFLYQQDGYYTVIIEASFAAIERTVQFYLLDKGLLTRDEYVNHETVYQLGEDAGLYGEEFAGKLENLWRNNRSDTYYREGTATQERARKMLDLAQEVHSHILQLAGERHECICDLA
jgi:hypothetical protein